MSNIPTTLPYGDERSSLVLATRGLFEAGVMSYSGHANLSARVGDGEVLLSAIGQVRDLGPADFAVVDLDGRVVEGSLAPTNAEIVEMHTRVYRARPDVGAVIHTHSPHLLAFALANRPLPARYEALLRFGQAEEVPVAPWAPRGTDRSVAAIAELAAKRPHIKAVLLGNHGVLAFAASVESAFRVLLVLEEAAQAELFATSLGGASDLPPGALAAVQASMARVKS